MLSRVLFLAAALLLANGDMYLHYPRGSNNRLNEQSANRNNANRLFDSQNNNRGGYNVGDMDVENGFDQNQYIASFTEMYDFRFLNTAGELEKQYEEIFFEGSELSVTWTNQHGAGNQKLGSHIILQYICDNVPRSTSAGGNGFGPTGNAQTSLTGATPAQQARVSTMRKLGLRVELYNGGNTNTPDEANNNNVGDITNKYASNNNNNRGRRESEEWYYLCENRARNKGLFHADQDLNGDAQKYTRQNPDGTRRGLECPEERDYYPYWEPTPFHDVAIITPDVAYCQTMLAPESQNVKTKYTCARSGVTTATATPAQYLPTDEAIDKNVNQAECEAAAANGEPAVWEGFKWEGTAPECVDSFWSKVNYLGNVDGSKRGGKQAHYDWTLPSYAELTNQHYCWGYQYTVGTTDFTDAGAVPLQVNCVRMMARVRYNMSVMDYDPYLTTSEQDEDNNQGVEPPIQQNPTVDAGIYAQGLQLAINTAQTGRTFQDNTHTFLVCERPAAAAFAAKSLINVGVRGKRGNIVQTFPATEYDFEPQHVMMYPGDCLHFQWTGSNTHNNGNPAGDGQAGDAGEGRGGSDRSQLSPMLDADESYPATLDGVWGASSENIFNWLQCYHPLFPLVNVDADSAALTLGTAGFYRSVLYASQQITATGEAGLLDVLLNNVSASFRQGMVCCVLDELPSEAQAQIAYAAANGGGGKIFSLVSTRNNNFTNRSQKFKIEILLPGNPMESKALW